MLILAYLLTAIILAYVGAKIAEHYGHSGVLGAAVGLVFHLPGILVLWVLFALQGGRSAED